MTRSVCVLCLLAVTVMILCVTGCGPSAEERTVMKQFNQLPELIEKGLYVYVPKEKPKYKTWTPKRN